MIISKRCSSISPSMTLAITTQAQQMKANGQDVISLGVGEPDFDTPEHIRRSAKDALDMGMTRYTPTPGTIELRRAIVQSLKQRNLDYQPQQIVVSNGAKHALHNAISAIINEGDEVLLPSPYWVSYPELIKMAGGTIKEVPCDDEFIIDTDALSTLITGNTRAIIINNPCNPTGALYPEPVLKEIAKLCITHDLYVISDEIYDQLVYDGPTPSSIATFPGMIDRTIVINGVSKTYAMTGWRIGYMAAPENVAKAVTAMQSQTASGPNSIAQYAAATALIGPQSTVEEMKKAFKERRDYAVRRIHRIKHASCPTPGGAFYIMMDISELIGLSIQGKEITGSLSFAQALLEDKLVAVIPGIAFGADQFIRLSYATSLELLKEGLDRIDDFIMKITKQKGFDR